MGVPHHTGIFRASQLPVLHDVGYHFAERLGLVNLREGIPAHCYFWNKSLAAAVIILARGGKSLFHE